MIPLDRVVADDLAALGADSRRQLRSAADALRAARATRGPSRRPADAGARELALLRVAGACAARVARIAGGATALACAAGVLVLLLDPRSDRGPGGPWPWWSRALDRNAASIGAVIAALAIAAYAIAGAIARRSVEARWRRAAAAGRDPLAGLTGIAGLGGLRTGASDGWAIALGVAGPTSAVLLTAALAWTIGRDRCVVFWDDIPEAGTLLSDRLRDLAIAIPAVTVAGLALGRACARRASWVRVLEHRGVGLVAALGGIAAVDVAFVSRLRPFSWRAREIIPHSSLRTALFAIGALAVFAALAGSALRRRRRELDDLDLASSGALAEPDPLALLPLAGVFRARAARVASGAIAAAVAIGLTIALHHPRRGLRGNDEIWMPRTRWQDWVLADHLTVVAIIAAVVLAAGVAGAELGDRLFHGRMQGLPPGAGQRALRLDLGRRMVRWLDAPAVILGVAGATALLALLAIIDFTIGDGISVFFDQHGPRVQNLVRQVQREMVAAVALGCTAALAIGQLCACSSRRHRARWSRALEHPAVIAAGAAIAIAASVVWLRLDFGVDDISAAAADQPSHALQSALTAAVTAALFAMTASLALRRRRGEHERTGELSTLARRAA